MSHITREIEYEEEEKCKEAERKRKEEIDEYYKSCSPFCVGMDYVKDFEEREAEMKCFWSAIDD